MSPFLIRCSELVSFVVALNLFSRALRPFSMRCAGRMGDGCVHGQAVLSAPTPRSLETCCKVVLWSYKRIRRNQPWELFVFQCLPKDVCCVWWTSCIMEQLLRACFSISGGFSLFEDSTNTKKNQDRFLLFLLFLNASAEKVHRLGKMKVLSSRTSTAAASITDPLLQGCLLM